MIGRSALLRRQHSSSFGAAALLSLIGGALNVGLLLWAAQQRRRYGHRACPSAAHQDLR